MSDISAYLGPEAWKGHTFNELTCEQLVEKFRRHGYEGRNGVLVLGLDENMIYSHHDLAPLMMAFMHGEKAIDMFVYAIYKPTGNLRIGENPEFEGYMLIPARPVSEAPYSNLPKKEDIQTVGELLRSRWACLSMSNVLDSNKVLNDGRRAFLDYLLKLG